MFGYFIPQPFVSHVPFACLLLLSFRGVHTFRQLDISPTDISPTDISPTKPKTFISPTQPKSDISPTQPKTFISPTQPKTFISPTQPKTFISPTDISPTDQKRIIKEQLSRAMSPSSFMTAANCYQCLNKIVGGASTALSAVHQGLERKMFIIGCYVNNRVVIAAHDLPGKTSNYYAKVLQQLKRAIDPIRPIKVMCDFETRMLKACGMSSHPASATELGLVIQGFAEGFHARGNSESVGEMSSWRNVRFWLSWRNECWRDVSWQDVKLAKCQLAKCQILAELAK
ncbi:hypothetical protein niasHT_018055 [Heterodera trifolii]|uniref:Uncharacterized protein n=1 Tax=Heterodera trifolii TaxID=157864 RepID=A0ABD2L7J2_9BILA